MTKSEKFAHLQVNHTIQANTNAKYKVIHVDSDYPVVRDVNLLNKPEFNILLTFEYNVC